jgi:hypothetical protein
MYEDEKRQWGQFGGLGMWVVEHTDCWIGVSGGWDLEGLVRRVLAEESRIGGQGIWEWSWSARGNGSEMDEMGEMGEIGLRSRCRNYRCPDYRRQTTQPALSSFASRKADATGPAPTRTTQPAAGEAQSSSHLQKGGHEDWRMHSTMDAGLDGRKNELGQWTLDISTLGPMRQSWLHNSTGCQV